MTEDAGKLSEEQKQTVQRWLSAQWKGTKTCPICTEVHWGASEHVVQPVTHSPPGTMNLGGGVSYPVILVICNKCGYTMGFNAVKMGLFKSDDAAKEDAGASKK